MVRKRFDLSLIPPCPDLTFERELWRQGLTLVAGIDEAGRGALCGPVAVGVVILPSEMADLTSRLSKVRDSKQMRPQAREQSAALIRTLALAWAVGMAEAGEIDMLGIAQATRLAVIRGINTLALSPQHLIIDYFRLPEVDLPQTSLVKGDQRSLSVACASVLAKTTRDALMVGYDQQYPAYGFGQHKGYGTQAHRQALEKHGTCPIHRRSFKLN